MDDNKVERKEVLERIKTELRFLSIPENFIDIKSFRDLYDEAPFEDEPLSCMIQLINGKLTAVSNESDFSFPTSVDEENALDTEKHRDLYESDEDGKLRILPNEYATVSADGTVTYHDEDAPTISSIGSDDICQCNKPRIVNVSIFGEDIEVCQVCKKENK